MPGWLRLAADAEHLFGPMVNEPGFLRALEKTVTHGGAWCVREEDGPPGTPLMGGLFFSSKPPTYKIGWLVVAEMWRRIGVARLLVEHVFGLVQPPAEMTVVTFAKDQPGGEPARRFYVSMGFTPEEVVTVSVGKPAQVTRQVFRRAFP